MVSEAQSDLDAALRRLEINRHIYAEDHTPVDASDAAADHRAHVTVAVAAAGPLHHTLHAALKVQVGAEAPVGGYIEFHVGESGKARRIEFALHLLGGYLLAVVCRAHAAAQKECRRESPSVYRFDHGE